MRILQVITQERGGPVDHALDVAEALASAGHESHVAGPAGAAGGRGPALAAAGVRWHPVDARSKVDLAGARRVARVVSQVRPDVLHAQDRRAGLFGRVAARALGVPSIYTLHGVPDGLAGLVPGNVAVAGAGRRTRLGCLTGERWVARATGSLVVTPCAAVGRYAVDAVGLPARRVRVVPNGVVVPPFPAKTPGHGRDGDPVHVVWVGVFQPVKRLPLLVDAVARCPEVELTLVGDGPERTGVERQIRRLGLRERVRLTGFLSDPTPELAGADLAVLPSAAEACPMALLQAMALGVPVLASRAGGIPEIVRDGVDGWLVDTADVAAWEVALRKLAGDTVLRTALGAAARSRVIDSFTLERCVARLLDLYAEAAGTSR